MGSCGLERVWVAGFATVRFKEVYMVYETDGMCLPALVRRESRQGS